ncbi:LuxR C-terminal-related transcriptional regulator [Aquihabitans sp. McL0605]|uniref:LuxR C-terminal-related transcriptional regulator n=1 Tax=Aquihabitans sp. McL0605 TaxID=3415671 RepID=UPI003CF631D2
MSRSLLIVDDHPWLAEALAQLASAAGWDPVDIAHTSSEGRALAQRLRPDLVSVDLTLGEEAGLTLIGELLEDQPHLTVVVLTGDVAGARALECIAGGASAFIPKSAQPDEILAAFDAASAGHTWLPVPLIGDVIDAALNPPPPTVWAELVASLSDREHDVLQLMVAGLDRRQIADELMISFNTVRTHVKNVLAKLGAHSTVEAVSVALRAGMQPPDGEAPTGWDAMGAPR